MKHEPGKNRQLPQILSILAVSSAGISLGAGLSWTSPSIPKILGDNATRITFEEASYFTVFLPIGTILTAPLYPYILNSIGRKKAILLAGVPTIVAWGITGLAGDNLWLFYAARFAAGVQDGAICATIPIYIGELAEPAVRGNWGNVLLLFVFGGKFLVNIVGSCASIKITALVFGCISACNCALSALVPESPYFLLKQGREKEAKESLRKLRWRADVDEELSALAAHVKGDVYESATLRELFTIDTNRRAICICVGTRLAQQFSGLFTFTAHTQYMFEEAGGALSATVSAVIFSGLFVPCLGLSSSLVEKFGRRPLAVVSSLGCAVALTVECIYFVLKQFAPVDLSSFNWVPLGGMIAYIVLCSCGLVLLPNLMHGEVLATNVKSKATAIIVMNQGASILIVPKLFQVLTYNLGLYAPFLFFACCTFASTAFFHFYMIETKGKTLEQVQQILKECTQKRGRTGKLAYSSARAIVPSQSESKV